MQSKQTCIDSHGDGHVSHGLRRFIARNRLIEDIPPLASATYVVLYLFQSYA